MKTKLKFAKMIWWPFTSTDEAVCPIRKYHIVRVILADMYNHQAVERDLTQTTNLTWIIILKNTFN